MTKREIMLQAINHKDCGIIPYNISFTGDFRKKVVREYGSEDILNNIGNYIVDQGNEEIVEIAPNLRQDQFGVVWLMDQKGDFGVVHDYILKEPTLDNYTFPEPDEAKIRQKCEWLVQEQNKDYFKMYDIGFSLFERAWSLRGMENLLMDFVLEPEFVEQLFAKITEYNVGVVKIAREYPIDGIYFGDDWGQQKGLIMGPTYWRQYIKPSLAKMYGAVKEKGLYICQHSCGDIHEVFEDVIELGLDIYNTFQPEIYDVEKVKAEVGDRLTFFGGISTQCVLPVATPAEVKAETQRMMRIMGKNGGYIVAPTHCVPEDVPVENILAFLEVVQNQG